MSYCTYCNYKWKVKEILSLGFSKDGKDWPICAQKQYISLATQKLFILGYLSLIFIPYFLLRIELSDKDERLFQ